MADSLTTAGQQYWEAWQGREARLSTPDDRCGSKLKGFTEWQRHPLKMQVKEGMQWVKIR